MGFVFPLVIFSAVKRRFHDNGFSPYVKQASTKLAHPRKLLTSTQEGSSLLRALTSIKLDGAACRGESSSSDIACCLLHCSLMRFILHLGG